MNVLALVRGGERYVLLWDDGSACEALETVQRFARDPELSFDDQDARLLGSRIIERWAVSRRSRTEKS